MPALTLLVLLAGTNGYDAAMSKAVALYNEAEWDAALRELSIAEKLAADEGQRVRVWLHEGIMLANVPNAEAAEAAWRRALEIDLKAELPLPVSPRVKALFEKVRSTTKEKPKLFPQQPRDTGTTGLTEGMKFPVVPVIALGGALVAAGVGLGFTLASNSTYAQARLAPTEAERTALSSRAWTQQLIGNIAFAVAGAAALIALITFIVMD